jgi:[ribosomal protein S5]-alanine N-acetyltransferase
MNGADDFRRDDCSPFASAACTFPKEGRFVNGRSLTLNPPSATTMATLQTPRLLLRPFTEEDLDKMAALMADKDFMRFSLGVFSREQTAGFLEKVRDRDGFPSQLGVIVREDDRLIGYCGFFPQIVDGIEELEIGYRIDPAYWGRGIATEATRAVRDHAFNDLHLPRVISLIHPDNIASRRVAEKNGMTPEKETVFRGFPTIAFSLHPAQW